MRLTTTILIATPFVLSLFAVAGLQEQEADLRGDFRDALEELKWEKEHTEILANVVIECVQSKEASGPDCDEAMAALERWEEDECLRVLGGSGLTLERLRAEWGG